jgi:TetR/AcrR family transcriptional repressor of nem operon
LRVPRRPLSERVSRNLRRTEEAFRVALIRAQDFGEIPTRHDPSVLARFLLNNLQGMRVLAKAGMDRATLEDAARVTLEVLGK